MGQPVKLSDQLVSDARSVADLSQRSIAGQIEFWATLGKSLEPILRGDRAIALRQAEQVRPLSELIAEVDTETGRARVRDYLESGPFPRYRPVENRPGVFICVEEDGTETLGRFVGRQFQTVDLDE